MCELLDLVTVIGDCATCNAQYAVPLANIRQSQQVRQAGSTGSSSHECQACYYATLVAPEVIEALVEAWSAFRRNVISHGNVDVVLRIAQPVAEPGVSEDLRSIRRWENEGGQCVPAAAQLE